MAKSSFESLDGAARLLFPERVANPNVAVPRKAQNAPAPAPSRRGAGLQLGEVRAGVRRHALQIVAAGDQLVGVEGVGVARGDPGAAALASAPTCRPAPSGRRGAGSRGGGAGVVAGWPGRSASATWWPPAAWPWPVPGPRRRASVVRGLGFATKASSSAKKLITARPPSAASLRPTRSRACTPLVPS